MNNVTEIDLLFSKMIDLFINVFHDLFLHLFVYLIMTYLLLLIHNFWSINFSIYSIYINYCENVRNLTSKSEIVCMWPLCSSLAHPLLGLFS